MVGSGLSAKSKTISVEIRAPECDSLHGVSDSPGRNTQVMRGLLQDTGFLGDNEELQEGEKVVMRILIPAAASDEHDDSSTEGKGTAHSRPF
jgi:hypothetical protein